ncbi:ABC transporter ATP-binding protein [Archangium gephyra]|uniref:ABC transporter ATP-binding protein n=1 Tax=Archangium gephyra TaxID=48 RepID=UPI003B81924B
MATPNRPLLATLAPMLPFARAEAGWIVAGVLAAALNNAPFFLFPQGIRFVIDGTVSGMGSTKLNQVLLGMLALVLVLGLATALRMIIFSLIGERVVLRLRKAAYQSIMSQEVAFFDERRVGELMNRLWGDTAALQSVLSTNTQQVLLQLVTALGGFAFLVYTSPALTAMSLLIVPVVLVGSSTMGRHIRMLSRDTSDAVAKAAEIAVESTTGIRTVRSFSAEQKELSRFERALDSAYAVARKRLLGTGFFTGLASMAVLSAVVLVFGYGSRLLVSGELSAGALVSFLVYTLMVMSALSSLSEVWMDIMRSTGAVERVFELLQRVPALPVSGGVRLPAVKGRLELQSVGFTYPSRQDLPVLKGIDLALQPGEVVALVGPSGSGKSTIASLLGRLYDPTEGHILLDGHALRELDPSWLRQQIGAVTQEPILFSCSVAENIRYGRADATDAEVEAAARAANAHDFILRFPQGYQTLVGERGTQLSGGQKQRVAIARAVLKNAPILILDEATSALDAESEHLVQEALEKLMKGRTTLIIAHRLSTVANADRVLVLDQGRVVQSGKHSELAGEEGLYKRLIERQVMAA